METKNKETFGFILKLLLGLFAIIMCFAVLALSMIKTDDHKAREVIKKEGYGNTVLIIKKNSKLCKDFDYSLLFFSNLDDEKISGALCSDENFIKYKIYINR